MGSVFEARHGATGRRVALKLIRPEFAPKHRLSSDPADMTAY
jgi:hypothetical protein